jgi:hypothetical protein
LLYWYKSENTDAESAGIANVVARYFSKYASSEVKKRELLSGQ